MMSLWQSLCVLGSVTTELSSSDLSKGISLGGLNAVASHPIVLAGHKSTLALKGSLEPGVAPLNSLSEASAVGSLGRIAYKAAYKFKTKKPTLALSAVEMGTSIGTELSSGGLQKLSLTRAFADVAGLALKLSPSFNVPKREARLKASSSMGQGPEKLFVQVDYQVGGHDHQVTVGAEKDLGDGKLATAVLDPQNQELEIEFCDQTLEPGATWTATATLKTDDLVAMPAVKFSRSMAF